MPKEDFAKDIKFLEDHGFKVTEDYSKGRKDWQNNPVEPSLKSYTARFPGQKGVFIRCDNLTYSHWRVWIKTARGGYRLIKKMPGASYHGEIRDLKESHLKTVKGLVASEPISKETAKPIEFRVTSKNPYGLIKPSNKSKWFKALVPMALRAGYVVDVVTIDDDGKINVVSANPRDDAWFLIQARGIETRTGSVRYEFITDLKTYFPVRATWSARRNVRLIKLDPDQTWILTDRDQSFVAEMVKGYMDK